ncbi:T9SS type B sorting domain-containing protein [Flavobacterium sp. HNIBRBA15423]|uniref:T9SS type B sorting domain-containing protein n=1 Tax=Flavobacterium sp. HNIBRBA15423 TaxID=3458683 RepID=UPI00404433A0
MKKLLLFFMSLLTFASYGQFFEGFEGTTVPDPPSVTGSNWVLPSGDWRVFDNGIGTAQRWSTVSGGQQYAGTRAAYLNRENVTDGTFAEDWLVSPVLTVPTDGQLRFYTKLTQAGIQGSNFYIRISTNTSTTPSDIVNTANYTNIAATWDESQLMNGTTLAEQTTYIQKVVDLSATYPAGTQIRIAFIMQNDNGDRWIVDNINVDSKCLDNTNLSATPLATSASLNWTSPSTATQWEIEYGPTGFVQGTGTIVTVNNPPPYNLTGLSSLTTYCFYVRSLCTPDNVSNWSGPQCFTTSALPPGCGGNFIDEGGSSANYPNSSDYIVTICPDNPGDFVTVTFTSFNTEATWDALYVFDGPSITSPQIASANGPGNVPGGLAGGFWGTAIPGPFESTDPSGCITFRFRSDTSVTNPGWTANIVCAPFPTCPKPIQVSYTSVSPYSGTVTWNHNIGAPAWDIYIVPTGSPAPTAGTTPTYANVTSAGPPYSYLATGLNSFTAYDVYVRAICDPSDISDWSNASTFTTAPDYCAGDHFFDSGGPSGTYAANENITTTICPDTPGTTVVAFFNSFNLDTSDFLTVYNGNSTAAPVLGTYTGTTLPPILVSTAVDGCLTFNFTSNGFTNLAGWDATIQCMVPPTCPNPNSLSVSSISDTGATLTWNEVGTATSWEVIIQPVGTGYPTGAGTIVTTNTYIATGLNPNTAYEFYVRADCGGGDLSFWSGPTNFTTLFPGCGGSVPAGDDVPEAAPVCNLNGYCGNTSAAYTDENNWPELNTAFCGSIENNSFLIFQATSTTISMDVLVGNCFNGSDIQFMIFSAATPGSGPLNVIGCFFQMTVGTNALTFNGLTVGQTYYLMIDGFAGAVCDYSVTVTSGGSTTTDVQITQSNTTICIDETLTLDVTGGNGIYNWSPNIGLNTTTGNTVTFTPPAPGTYTIQVQSTDANALCATSDFIEVTVLEKTIPSFSVPGPFCLGDPSTTLSDTSNNGVQGVWTPSATIDTSTAGITQYTFTPDASFQCAEVITIDVEVTAACTFNSLATAVFIESCETTPGGEFYNITGAGSSSIGPLTNVFPNNDYGTFVQNSGNLILKGAELKSFMTSASNVCGANLYYRVYESSSVPGAFTTIALPFFDDCVAGNFPSGGTCNVGDQKWQDISSTIDLTTFAPGDYIVEVYFDLLGDNDDPTQCDDTIFVNNGGNNFIATFSIQSTPTFTSQNEECGSSNAFITVSGFNPGDVYSVTYDDDTLAVGPANFTANSNGEILISGLNAGIYENFNFEINGCSIFDATPINITNFSPSVTQITNNSDICFGSDAIFTVTGTANYSLDYSVNGGSPQTVTFDSSGTAIITVGNPAVGNVNLALLSIYNSACNIILTNTDVVIVNPLPQITSFAAANNIACLGNDAEFIINGTPNAIVTYSVDGGASQTVTLDGSGTYTITIPTPSSNVEIVLIDITNTATTCSRILSGIVANVTVVSVPVPTAVITQPTCAVQTATVEVTSPLINQLNYPSDLFISEVTDSQSGSLTYIEIYNGTGATVDLSNYKIRLYNGGGYPTFPPTNEYVLSGMLNNDDVVVIKIGSSANVAGVVPDLSFTGFNINNNDNIRLTNLSNVDIDVWGYSDGSVLPYGIGYDYRRNTSGTILPSITWDPADWTATDWNTTTFDYSDVGNYTLFVSSYEYTLSDGTTPITQTTPIFSNVSPGTYSLVAYDSVTGCTSDPLDVTINTVALTTPVVTFSYDSSYCISGVNPLPDTSAPGFDTTGTFSVTSSNSADITIDPVTGEIDLSATSSGTYEITYSVAEDLANCISANSSFVNVTINDTTTPTFDAIADLCSGSSDTQLPASSLEGYTGTWSPSSINTTTSGVSTYTFTPDSQFCATSTTIDVSIISCTIQKGISPNTDGLNDTFDLSGFNVSKLEIFNRYGKEVYTKSGYENEWFGQTNNGDELPDGTYYYVIEFADMESRTGWIYINRQQ